MQMQVRMERICPWIEVVFPFPKDYSIIAIKSIKIFVLCMSHQSPTNSHLWPCIRYWCHGQWYHNIIESFEVAACKNKIECKDVINNNLTMLLEQVSPQVSNSNEHDEHEQNSSNSNENGRQAHFICRKNT